jgi:hypothetical protein
MNLVHHLFLLHKMKRCLGWNRNLAKESRAERVVQTLADYNVPFRIQAGRGSIKGLLPVFHLGRGRNLLTFLGLYSVKFQKNR